MRPPGERPSSGGRRSSEHEEPEPEAHLHPRPAMPRMQVLVPVASPRPGRRSVPHVPLAGGEPIPVGRPRRTLSSARRRPASPPVARWLIEQGKRPARGLVGSRLGEDTGLRPSHHSELSSTRISSPSGPYTCVSPPPEGVTQTSSTTENRSPFSLIARRAASSGDSASTEPTKGLFSPAIFSAIASPASPASTCSGLTSPAGAVPRIMNSYSISVASSPRFFYPISQPRFTNPGGAVLRIVRSVSGQPPALASGLAVTGGGLLGGGQAGIRRGVKLEFRGWNLKHGRCLRAFPTRPSTLTFNPIP